MFIKIYFNKKPLFLCDAIDEKIEPYVHHDDAVFIDELNSHTVKAMIHEMQLEKIHAGVFYHPDLTVLSKTFFKKFHLIKAGGGLVTNGKQEILMIHRRGSWDLPKGKLDEGETIAECAVREVTEETGLGKIKLIAPLLVTYHTYHEGSTFVLKESHWFLMSVKDTPLLTAQAEEQITEAKWLPILEVKKLYPQCFPSVIDVIETFNNNKKN